jgi:hypothetical protein
MIDELDFVLVPDEAWQLLVDEFNITPGQEPIARKVKIIIMFCNLIELKVPLSISYFMYFNNAYEWDVLNFFVCENRPKNKTTNYRNKIFLIL